MVDDTTEAQDERIAAHIIRVHRFQGGALEDRERVPYSTLDMQHYIRYARSIKPRLGQQASAGAGQRPLACMPARAGRVQGPQAFGHLRCMHVAGEDLHVCVAAAGMKPSATWRPWALAALAAH